MLSGARLSADDRHLLRAGIGGVVLFERNIGADRSGDPARVRELILEARRVSERHLHVAIDEEGGHVLRLRDGVTTMPSQMAIGATGSARLARAAAWTVGRQLARLGIDAVLAPVLDIAADPWNPTVGARAYGSDPLLVARLGAAAVRGYLSAGVLPVPKHFPGHGRTPLDSHVAHPVVGGAVEELEAFDLVPFRAAVAARAPMLMSSHVRYEASSDGLPASLSPWTGSIAQQIGFRGALITDAMVMDAVADGRSIPHASVHAIAAGADLIMALDPAARVISEIAAAIADGRVPRDRVAAALARAERLARVGARLVGATPVAALSEDRLADAEADRAVGHDVAAEIARRALTIVGDGGLLPLSPDASVVLIDLPSSHRSPIEGRPRAGERRSGIVRALAATFPRLRAFTIAADDPAARAAALAAATGCEIVLVATRDAYVEPAYRRFLVELGATAALARTPVGRLALRSPVDLVLAPAPDLAVAAYADVPLTCAALASALVRASAAFPGVLPMRLPSSVPTTGPEEEAA